MAMIINCNNDYNSVKDIERAVNYILGKEFFIGGGKSGCLYLTPKDVANSFALTQKQFNKESGKRMFLIILGFGKDELYNKNIIFELASEMSAYIGQLFQNMYGIHSGSYNNGEYEHVHFVINSVSFYNGSRFACTYDFFQNMIFNFLRAYDVRIDWRIVY